MVTYLRTPGGLKNKMCLGKHKRLAHPSVIRAIHTAMRVGNVSSIASTGHSMYKRRRTRAGSATSNLQCRVSNISSSIETKESAHQITDVQLAHKNVTVFDKAEGCIFNPFDLAQGVGEQMN
jgi:hypothetical protein